MLTDRRREELVSRIMATSSVDLRRRLYVRGAALAIAAFLSPLAGVFVLPFAVVAWWRLARWEWALGTLWADENARGRIFRRLPLRDLRDRDVRALG